MESSRTLKEVLWPEIEAIVRSSPRPPGEMALFIIFRNNPQGFTAQDCEDLPRSQRRGVSARTERKLISVIDRAIESIATGGVRQQVVHALTQHLRAEFGKWIQVAETGGGAVGFHAYPARS